MRVYKKFSEVIVELCNWLTEHNIDLNGCNIEIDANFKVETPTPKGDDIISMLAPWLFVDLDDIINAFVKICDSKGNGYICVFDGDGALQWRTMYLNNPYIN
jgi:hypothetical protein